MAEIYTIIKKKPNAKKSNFIIRPPWILHAILTIQRKKRDRLRSLGNYNFTILSSVSSSSDQPSSKQWATDLQSDLAWAGFLHTFYKAEFHYSHLKLTTNTAETLRKRFSFYTTVLNYRLHGEYEQFYSLELKITTWLSSKYTLLKTKDSNNCWPGIKILYITFGSYNCFHF